MECFSFCKGKEIDVGEKYRAVCVEQTGYESCLTIGDEYDIEIAVPILEDSPVCRFVGNNGKTGLAHLKRFKLVKE